MRKWIGMAALVVLSVIPTSAQSSQDNKVPSWEFGGGYTFRNYSNPFTVGPSNLHTNGWDVMADYMVFRKWLSIGAQADGTYVNEGLNGKTSVYSIMAGPQFYPFGHRRKLTFYGQFLFGEGYTRFVIPQQGGFPTTTATSNAFAWQAGVGLDRSWKERWSIRIIQFDYENTKFFGGNPAQGNYKISAGILYRFGKLKKGR
jgi:hypothetical protein